MAFVYKAERQIVLSSLEGAKEKNIHLGPGTYQAEKPTGKHHGSRPPFCTTTGRSGKAINQPKIRTSYDIGMGQQYPPQPDMSFFTKGKKKVHQQAGSMQAPNYAQAGYTPGPGSYNVTNGFEKIQRDMQSAQTLQGFGIDAFGLNSSVKPHTSFVSRVKRFNGSDFVGKTENPGPGAYHKEGDVGQMRGSNAGWSKGTSVPALIPNPPSIPSHQNVFGYEENSRGELIRQSNTEKVHTGVNKDTVGPGEYTLGMDKTKKGTTKWVKPDLSEKIKEIKQKKTAGQPGPGTYEPPSDAINPIYKKNTSSVFASGVPRAQSSAALMKNRIKVVNRDSSNLGQVSPVKYRAIAQAAQSPSRPSINDILESDDSDGDGPGPGQYFVNQQVGSFKQTTKPQRLQFFGSTVERFTDQNKFKGQSSDIGPGTYVAGNTDGIANRVKKQPFKSRDQVCFASGQQRFAYHKQNGGSVSMQQLNGTKIVTPGPGAYEEGKTLALQMMRKALGNKKPFDCEQKRQPEYSKVETPGPGQYDQNIDTAKEEAIKRSSSSMFISKTKRNSTYNQIVKKAKENPGLERVCYEVDAHTIADNLRRKAEQINNPLLAALTTKNNTTLPFTSNAPRFQLKILDEETYIGPGYYEQKSCFEQSLSKFNGSRQQAGGASTQASLHNVRSMQQISTVGPGFNALNKATAAQQSGQLLRRTGGNEQPKVTPGPGHYSSPDLNHWFKKSYNQNFNEV